MATDAGSLYYTVDARTEGLLRAERDVSQSTRSMERDFGRVEGSLTGVASGVKTAVASLLTIGVVGGAFKRVIQDTANFEQAMLQLRAVSGSTEEQMAALEKQAREMGATTQFSAQQAAEGQRFLAQAGFDANQILSATPGILQLATAGSLDLARAADIASNVLGQFQLPVSELSRVNDVLADSARSANTDIDQMAQALSQAGPIANSAGISLEEAAAAVGALSNAGIQGGRAGTGLLGVIRQLSNITPQAQKTLNGYGLSVSDVNIESNGLTTVLGRLRDANLSTADAFAIFQSEAGPAAQILSASADEVSSLAARYKDATGTAKQMADIIGSGLSGAIRSFNSALGETILQLGNGGVGEAFEYFIKTAGGVLSAYNGMLDAFAKGNHIGDEQKAVIMGVADGLKVFAAIMAGRVVASAGSAATALAAKTAASIRDMAATRSAEAAEAGRAAVLARTAAAEKAAEANSASLAATRASSARMEAAAESSRLAAVKASLTAERVLETQRLQAQISATGRQQSLARLAELRTAETATINQQTAAASRLAAAQQAEASATRLATAATTQQTASSAAATAALGRYAAASRATSAASTAMAVATRAASGALALVGGPVGLAVVAAGALFYFREELGLTGQQADSTQKQLAELRGEMRNLSNEALDSKIKELTSSLVFLEDQARNTRMQVDRLRENGGTFDGQSLEDMRNQLKRVDKRAEDTKKTIEQLQDLRKGGDGVVDDTPPDRPNTGGGSGFGSGDDESKKLKAEFERVKQQLESQRETIEREYADRNETIRKATVAGSDEQEDLLNRSGEKRKQALQELSDQLVGITSNQIQRINQQYNEQNREILRLTEKGSAEQIEALTRNEANRQKAIDDYRAQELGSLRSHTEQINAEYRKQQQSILNATEEGSQERIRLQQKAAENYAVTYREAQAKELQDTLNHQQAMKDAELEYQAARIQQMTGFTAEASARLAEFQANSADPARFISESFQNAFTQLDDTIATTFTNGIRQGESFGDIMANVGRSIVADLLQSLVKLGVQMAINAAIGQSSQAAAVAGAAATGATMAASYAPAAALASLASFGANAAPASAALASTVALSQGLALAGGRQYGGNVNAGSMYRVTEDGKPEMYSDGSRSYLLPGRNGKVTANKDMASGGQTVVQNHIQLIGKGAENARVNQTRDSAGNQVTQIILADMQENGPISRGFTQNFNTSRRGN